MTASAWSSPSRWPAGSPTWRKLGAVSLPLASLFGPDALAYRLTDAGAVAAVVSAENRAKVEEGVPGLDIIEVGADFDALGSFDPIVPADTAAEDPVFLIYTSGTTAEGSTRTGRCSATFLPSSSITSSRRNRGTSSGLRPTGRGSVVSWMW